MDSFSTQASAAELHLSHTSLIQSLPNIHNLKYIIESACTQNLNISYFFQLVFNYVIINLWVDIFEYMSYLSIVGVDFDCWGKSIFCFMITFQLDVAHTNQEMTLRSLHWPRFSSPWFLQHYKYNSLVSWVHRTNNTISNTHNIKYLNFSHIDFSWFIFLCFQPFHIKHYYLALNRDYNWKLEF